MPFTSLFYLVFLGLIVVLSGALRSARRQNGLLLAAGYVFYATWDWRFVVLLGGTTVFSFLVSRGLARLPDGRRRRLLLILGVGVNLAALGFFKYFNFFAESATALLTGLGVQVSAPTLTVLLPVGISFYTFQAIGYLVDTHNRKFQPAASLIDFGLFLAFFPLLLAGPIERGPRLLPQIQKPRRLTPDRVESGLILIGLGLFRKIVIADVAASLIDPALFEAPADFPAGQVLVSLYLFALQIYGDFAGYSDVARGSAQLLGFDLMENFNQPYLAQTVSEFWRRWHISLSSWLRDYLFFPLSRALLQRQWPGLVVYALATLVTMLLAGLWHGAAWTYVAWGGLLGLYLIAARLLQGKALRWRKHPRRAVRWAVAGASILLTFHLILVAWALFRSPSLESALAVLSQSGAALAGGFDPLILGWLPVGLLGLTILIDAGQVWAREQTFTRRLPLPAGAAIYAAALLLILIFLVKPYVPFFYFRF